MTKLLQNKTLIKFLGIALSILLIVALIPQIGIAYGSKDDVMGETPMAETGEGNEATDEGEEAAADGDEAATSEEGAEPAEGEDAVEGEVSVVDGVEMVSHKVEVPGEEDEDATENAIATQSSEDEGTKTRSAVKTRSVQEASDDVLVVDSAKTITLPSSELEGIRHIVVANGTLTLKGKGTIDAAKTTGTYRGETIGSVILVTGSNSKLIVEGEVTITGGVGTAGPKNFNGGALVGGGIYVRDEASLHLKSGVITSNTADGGGGIFIGYPCKFTMDGGVVSGNTANHHEGGGIYFAGKGSVVALGEVVDNDAKYGAIKGGTIENNTTNTTADWGGGGVFVQSGAFLYIASAQITENKAHGYGGGVSGCPHAEFTIGAITDGAAIFKNYASVDESGNKVDTNWPTVDTLRFLMTGSTLSTNKKIPAGDLYARGVGKGHPEHGNVTAEEGIYASHAFKSELAKDYYCTKASIIGATDLADDKGVAWIGYKAGIPAFDPPTPNDAKSVSTEDMRTAEPVKIYKGEAYAAPDVSLGLTSQATSDPGKDQRAVFIRNNYSNTHGGGVGCNGTIRFGTLGPGESSGSNTYSIKIKKSLINNLGESVKELDEGEFEFKLEQDDKVVATATNDKDGNVFFTGFKGKTEKGSEFVEYILKESPKEGYSLGLPDDGIKIEVVLKTESKTATVGGKNITYYETSVEDVSVLRECPETVKHLEKEKTIQVTNTLNLRTSVELPVTKIAYGIHKGTFTFDLKEIEDPTVENGNDLSLKEGISLAHLAAGENHQTVSIDLSKWLTEQDTETKWFNLGSFTEPGEHWYAIAEEPSENEVEEGVSYDKTTYLVRVKVTLSEDGRTLNKQLTKWEVEPGSADLKQVDPDVAVSFENVGMKYAGFSLDLNKRILTTLGGDIPLNGRTFNFALYDGDTEVAAGTTDGNGAVSLAIDDNLAPGDESYAKRAYAAGENTTVTFTLKETVPEGTGSSYVTTIPDATVEVELSAAGERTEVDGHTMFLVTPTVESVTVNGTDVEVADKAITVTNRYAPNGTWNFKAKKFFYGLGTPSDCSFSLVEIEREPGEGEAISSIAVKKDLENKEFKPLGVTVSKDTIGAGGADIEFPAITYVVEGKGKNQRNDIGDHYYLVTEDGDDAAKDTTAYVVKVTVAVDKKDPGKLVATGEVRGYADDLNSTLNPMPKGQTPAFYNTDTQHMISAASYSVYAASGEPVDQVCYVDPKIIKNLEGRAIKSGEFAFKLIEVANYNDTEGTVISATTNDEFGMVDFDKANNVSGDLENPSCLAYTKPGTYYYRVIEDTTKGGMNDQSVLYSDQVITFTTVIKQDEATGRLVCTDMYYGYWDKAANKNVRYDEQYTDFDTQPANIGDMSKLNPDWHPTITNKTRPMDIQVRKTSVTDRSEGLVGATYALYMVNENAQGDIKLAEATSEDGGWITYKNVSLSTNNLYYFKETAAPAGHTVSEFRSSYFYLVEDASSVNGYALQYTDTKFLAEAAAAAEPQAVALLDEADAQAAAEAANETAGNTETQPGHSADGNVLLTYDKDGGVYDEATQVEVNKLDTRTHEWVEGAKLVILEKESGKEIASWTSGKASQKLEKTLNVGTTYLLREVEAPNQYRLANDVEFVIDDYGNVSITKGTENGNAELSDNSITLYDTMMDAEEVETVEREKSTTEKPKKDTLLAKTGDMLPILGIALVALAALIVVIVAVRRRRASEDETTQS